ncbi:MAG: malonate decarboxylase holo-[acyl-carrier-protein] synthase [Deltaproteobacteria bacterium]|nr:malonate decarboxylase holo-[acyl-carrier-protein] synthase [Deltaproteobacteria bacterium]
MNRMVQRHDLVWLDPFVDLEIYADASDLGRFSRNWVGQSRPFVVTRQPKPSITGESRISLGLTLPPPLTRQRVTLHAPREAVIRHTAPLGLAEALPHAPPAWHDAIERILLFCQEAGATPYVYGSLSWQAVTGHGYLTENSDLDVLFVCDEGTDMQRLLGALSGFKDSTPRLDGEIVVPTGWGAAWREFAAAYRSGGAIKLLAKSRDEVRLLAADEFLGPMAAKDV